MNDSIPRPLLLAEPIADIGRRFSALTQIYSRTLFHSGALRKIEKAEGTIAPAILHFHMAEWATEMMRILNVEVTAKGEKNVSQGCLLLGNHISYLDIPLLMLLRQVVFVAKKQIAHWPVFGSGCRTIGTILVDRGSKSSRETTGQAVGPRVKGKKQNVVIFPSGTTCLNEEKPWRWGAFQIAKTEGIPVQPFRIRYTPARRAAYLMEDIFLPHLWRLLDGSPLKVSVEFHSPVEIHDPQKDCEYWWRWSREGLQKEIE